jgi:hypothetical protein
MEVGLTSLSKNKALKYVNIFPMRDLRPNRHEQTEKWIKLHEKLHNLCILPSGGKRKGWIIKLHGKRPLWIQKCKYEDNIKLNDNRL